MVLNAMYAFFISLIGLLLSANSWATVNAKLDRNEIHYGESVTLVLSVDATGLFSSPELGPLEKDFQILGSSQNSRTSFINGSRSSTTEWHVDLMPKTQGRLTIPAIELDGEKTQPLKVTVKPAQQPSAQSGEAVFIKAESTTKQVYVQQQIELNIKVFHAVNLSRDASLSELEVDNAIVQKLATGDYQTQINGVTYRVFEQKYAIFPQASGELTIGSVILRARLPITRRERMLDPFAMEGKPIAVATQPLVIDVQPIPNQLADDTWLPTPRLDIFEDWSQSADELTVGEAVTRTITTVANNLLGAQLPPSPVPEIAGLKIYPDQPTVSDGDGETVKGVRVDSMAIIATTPGTYTLPEQRIQWWDTRADMRRETVLPAKTITVKAAPTVQQLDSPPVEIASATQPVAPLDLAGSDKPSIPSAALWPWQLATLLLIILNVILMTLLLRRRGSKSQVKTPLKTPSSSQDLARACKNKEPRHALQALQEIASRGGYRSLTEFSQANPSLKPLLRELEDVVYGQGNRADWQPTLLVDTVETILKQKNAFDSDTDLPPLYP